MRRSALTLLLAALPAVLSAAARAADPRLVADLNPSLFDPNDPRRSEFRIFTTLGARAVVSVVNTYDVSTELYATDGTAAGTERLRSFEHPLPEPLGTSGAIFYFVHPPPFGSRGPLPLWRSDGTREGTFPLAGVGTVSSQLLPAAGHRGAFYFTGCTAAAGCELWATDGTQEGTRLVRDIAPGRFGSAPRSLLSAGDLLYFFADDPVGPGLWATDGSRRGTRRIARLPRFQGAGALLQVGSRRLFTLNQGGAVTRRALWTSDGTAAGTRPLLPRGGPSVDSFVGSFGGLVLFFAGGTAGGAASRAAATRALWATDGTARGTRRLADLPRDFFFSSANAVAGRREILLAGADGTLWVTRGTRATTHRLAGCPGGCPQALVGFGSPILFPFRDRVFFVGFRAGVTELWESDGSGPGTRPSPASSPPSAPVLEVLPVSDPERLYFLAGSQLWATDGTAGGTEALAAGPLLSDPGFGHPSALAGRRLVFGARTAERGLGLWSTDGTPGGTGELRNLARGSSSSPALLAPFGERAFLLTCFADRLGAWASDGTAAGTVQLLDDPGFCSGVEEDRLGRLATGNGAGYFLWIAQGDFWAEVYRTDGTPEGTSAVTRLGPGFDPWTVTALAGKILVTTNDAETRTTTFWSLEGDPPSPVKLFDVPVVDVVATTVLDGELYFFGGAADGPLFFRSDGTAAGTVAVAPARPISILGWIGTHLYFFDGRLWRSDGTLQGSAIVLPSDLLVEGPTSTSGVAVLGTSLYLMSARGHGFPPAPGLFKSDGTIAGTALLAGFAADAFSFVPPPRFAALGGRLFFTADDGEHGAELWATDGTRAGTVLVRDIRPGPGGSAIGPLTVALGKLYFAADDGEHGAELWESDGTAAGTRLVADLAPGAPSSLPADLIVSGESLFLTADDGTTGREPWVLDLDETGGGAP